ncbi:bifunctional DNA-formamidopyrimidine glycosylase/DNA-(apurinic or apyrimidinic site) lyase [Rhodovibrio salinarum]|uniref:Formamidopyrimidine-DNA glycosylase n=1 Tax=Rhodovibrio salinarum TaxID=1087 RepID=A0A934QHP8_9PROT|nr:bifunctional DNA-formamidopyrimidine glycosylase/DNA-(apurinic or apyrimidinic site) lyase [Rhodovibrio salinarum]MBK1696999.1 bifunctional DNA-formamidopyrimidine glycosylase/DNA-(apurinic or apyrimidinic site) lyase [Rhodovibrio salinarum]
MPELPEVETVCRGLRPWLEGRRLASVIQRRPDLRWPLPENFAQRLEGRMIVRIDRRAKYMLAHLDDGWVLLMHLGMSGRMAVAADPDAPFEPHDHVVFLTDEGCQVRFNDPRRFGFMDLLPAEGIETSAHFRGLGPEPLGNAFNGPELAARLAGRRTPIKAALLDQKTVAGLGNIYVCEALYVAGLSPKRQAHTVQGKRAERLAAATRSVLTRAIAAGGSSLRDYRQASGELGYFQHDWAVYDKEGQPCPDCDCTVAATGGIQRLVQANRSTFYCPRRQR